MARKSREIISARATLEMCRRAGIELRVRVVMQQHVDWVLDMAGGNLSAAAAELGVDRRSLQRHNARRQRNVELARIIRAAIKQKRRR